MADRTYAYIDGESHFLRSEAAWKKLRGQDVFLEQLRYVGNSDDGLTLVNPKAKVFWTRKMNAGLERAIYFTSFVGDDKGLHEIQVSLRNFALEPSIAFERKQLAAQRANTLKLQGLIEKPKGVDIALAVRVLEDTYNQVFDTCHLYTSDVDFLPVIQVIQAKGKRVYVHGYTNGLGDQSPFLHVPDGFVNLEDMLRDQCELASTGGN